jgi:hypothetical protein
MWRLFVIGLVGAALATGAGYFACVHGASLLQTMAFTAGLFGLIAVGTIVWLARREKATGGPPVIVAAPALRKSAIALGFLVASVAIVFVSYAVTQNRAVELAVALAVVVPAIVVLMRGGLWPDQFASAKDAGMVPGFVSVQLALLVVFSLNLYMMLTARPTADRDVSFLHDADVAAYAVAIQFIIAAVIRMLLTLRAAARANHTTT